MDLFELITGTTHLICFAARRRYLRDHTRQCKQERANLVERFVLTLRFN